MTRTLDTTATVVAKRQLTDATTLLVVSAPLVAAVARPGQFVIVRASETGERMPISITDADAEAGTVTLVVQRVGHTSGLVSDLEPGERILDLAGPLGAPVELPRDGHVVLVGGGFGAGAILPLARELRRRGVPVDAIVGARTASLLVCVDLLEPVCWAVRVCTDDGSAGFHGVVTGLLEELVAAGAGYTRCYAVGPMPMMRAVAATAARLELPSFVSLDPLMVDGTGMCGGCRVTVDGQTRFACVDGPFFEARAVDFAEAAARKSVYAAEEQVACALDGGE